MKKLRVLELFGGIGAIRKALINQNIPFKIVDYVEIDKNAVKSYNALYNENYEPNSVEGYHAPSDSPIDLCMHGSPCQDFSVIGLQQGGEEGSGTRSSLLFETIRILKEMSHKPKVVIWENVYNVMNGKHRTTFEKYILEMKRMGYSSKYDVLNSIEFGVPQYRKRLFVVSVLGENKFNFSKLDKQLSPLLDWFIDQNVPQKYEVTQPSILDLINETSQSSLNGRVRIIKNYAYTITTKQMRVPNSGFISLGGGRYRYLTERECFRLMGFSDDDFDILERTHPKSECFTSTILYRQAGNSIVVNVLEAILKTLLQNNVFD